MAEDSPLALGADPNWSFETENFTIDENEYKPPLVIVQMEEAVAEGNLDAVQNIFKSHMVNESEKIDVGRFASSYAVAMAHGHIAVASYLLSVGVTINIFHFMLAVERKSYSFLELFLDYGWDINQPISWAEPPPLSLASRDKKLAQWMLSHGANPNAQCVLDFTPLSKAVLDGSFAIIKLMFEYGGSIEYGQLLHYAVRRQNPDCLRVLTFIIDKRPPINHVMYQNHVESQNLQHFITFGTALHTAAEAGNLDMVDILLKAGADPLIKDSRGMLAVERAEYSGNSAVVDLLRPISVGRDVREAEDT